ncbi:unnamed protein product [Amoebophrya sp. A120]|nr:unnamed protein product [Amoebophrya sp. A120]|eukprot:GSA120T00014863001.1
MAEAAGATTANASTVLGASTSSSSSNSNLAQEVDDALRDLHDLQDVRSAMTNIKKLRKEVKELVSENEAKQREMDMQAGFFSQINRGEEEMKQSSAAAAQPGREGGHDDGAATAPSGPTGGKRHLWSASEVRMQERIIAMQKKKAELQQTVLALQTKETDLRLQVDEVRREVYTAREQQKYSASEKRWRKFLHRKKYQLYKQATGIRWADPSGNSATGAAAGAPPVVSQGVKGYVSLDRVSAFDLTAIPDEFCAEALWNKIEHCAGLSVHAGANSGSGATSSTWAGASGE